MPRNRKPESQEQDKPALLVSFVYLKTFRRLQSTLSYRDWVLDSGAFSAFNIGSEIKLDDYIETCKQLLATDQTLTEIFSLDVIGDFKAGLKNNELMWKQGIKAIPCYHFDEPEWVLKEIAANFPKIALGGCAMVPVTTKLKWAEQCFARVFPKKIHGFGFGSQVFVERLPFDSVDSSSWCTSSQQFGKWKAFGDEYLRSRGTSILAEIEFYLRVEREARGRWHKVMKQLGSTGPTVRLAQSSATFLKKYFRHE